MNNPAIQFPVQTMSSKEIADLVDSRHDSVKRSIERLAESGVIQLPPMVEVKNQSSQTVTVYNLTKRDSYIVVAQLSPEFTARLVDRWQELEAITAPQLPATYLEALQALIASEQEKQAAIETKAEIGTRREATAMNTASQQAKRANKLEIELDRSQDYATVKRMSMIYHGQKFKWRELKSAAIEMGLPAVDVFDANYGTVKAYHSDVWLEVYALPINGGAE